MSFNQRMKKAKGGVRELLLILDKTPVFGGEDAEKTKSILKTQKEAFMSASEIITHIHEWEENEGAQHNVKWYSENLTELMDKGEHVIDVMFDGINSSISRANEESTIGDISAKKEAPAIISMITIELKKLKAILDQNAGSETDFIMKKESKSWNMEHAK